MTAPEVLKVTEIARMMRVSTMTVYRHIHTKELRAYRVGRTFRVRADDFAEFMRAADTWGEDA